MDADTFRQLTTDEIAHIVRQTGTKICVFPVKGTRRWFMLEYPAVPKQGFAPAYLDAVYENHITLYKRIFDHGIHTLLTPSFDAPLMERGEAYMRMAAEGLTALATHPAFLNFYETCDVRVRFYGAYREHLTATPYAHLIDIFDTVMARTEKYHRHRLFFGLFVHDTTETIAELAIRHYREYGHAPDRRALVEEYYGEYIEPVDIFIGFSKLRVFDMPLLMTGKTDLYFTVNPSPYLTEMQLRDILYDHLYARRTSSQTDYSLMQPEDQDAMRTFYQSNINHTLGIGRWHPHWKFWYPVPQVQAPPDLNQPTRKRDEQ